MAAKGYTTKSKIENYTLVDIDAAFNTQVDEWIEAVEQEIDLRTGRNFIADSAATARLYNGSGTDVLIIDDAVEVTTVEVGLDSYGGSFLALSATGADRYFLEPANYTVDNVPVTRIRLSARQWAGGTQNARITAKWGYSASVPQQISFIATVLVAGIINEQRGGGDKITMESIGNYKVSYDVNDENGIADFKNAMRSLDSYKRYRL